MDAVSNLLIKLTSTGDTAALTSARAAMEGLTSAVNVAKTALAGLGVSFGLVGLEQMAKAGLQLGKNIVDMADRLKMSTAAFQVMGEVARKAGLDTDGMTTILGKLRGTIDTAAESGGKAEKAFEALGLNAKELAGVPLEDALIAIATQVENAKDKTAAYAAAVEILGAKNLPKLNEVLHDLATGGFGEAAKQAKILDDAQLKLLKDSADSWERWYHNILVGFATADAAMGGFFQRARQEQADFDKYGAAGAPKVPGLPAGTITSSPASAQDLADTDNSPEAIARRSAIQTAADQEAAQAAKDKEADLKIQERLSQNISEWWDKIAKADEKSLEMVNKMTDPFYEISVKMQEIQDAKARGAISDDQSKAAMAVLAQDAGEIADKLMTPLDQGGHKPSEKSLSLFQQDTDRFKQSQSTDPNVNPSYMTASQGAEAALMQFGAKAGSIGNQVQNVFTTAFTSIESNLNKVITGTETWRKALTNITVSIESSILTAFEQMGIKWITTQIMMAVQGKAIAGASAAAMLPIAAVESETWAAPATLATIASFGGAALAAPGEIMAAIAASQGLALASAGGFFPGDEGSVAGMFHGGEYVFSAPAVRNIGAENLDRAHTMAKSGAPAAPAAAAGMTQSLHFHDDRNAAFRAAMRDPANFRTIVDIHARAQRHV
jgi:hypothetical protein